MTIGEWIEHTELVRNQYQEGCITAFEYVCKVLSNAAEIPEEEFQQVGPLNLLPDEGFPTKEDFIEQWVGKELPKA